MGSCGNDGSRSDCKWRLLRQGEVSPSKVLVALLMREVYLSSGDLRKIMQQPDERMVSSQTLLFIYKLITTNDVSSFGELKGMLEDPEHRIRPEVIKRFLRIVSNLEPGNSYFLYELAYSIISIEASHTIILKKKVGKNSPFGKFLRNVYMNIRRMSYPQVHFLYTQLSQFLNFKRKKSLDESATFATITKFTPENQKTSKGIGKELQQDKNSRKFRGLDVFQKLTDILSEERKINPLERVGVGVDLFSQYTMEYRRTVGNLTVDDEKSYITSLQDKKTRVEKAKETTKSLRDLWKPKELIKGCEMKMDQGSSSMFARSKRRSTSLRRSHLYITPRLSPRSPRKTRGNKLFTPQEFIIVDEGEEGYFPSDEEYDTPTFKSPIKSPTKSPRGKRKFPVKEAKEIVIINATTTASAASDEVKKFISKEIMPSKRWECVKGWSRRQIEKAVKSLASQLYHTNCPLPCPQEISEFVEAVLKNPSAQVLFPQLHFLEYLNGLRVKDVSRCADSLRTSFDIRIKPNTSELNKGIPYAAYNFALFYNLIGYKEDAMSNLEEAFRAGHASGDATCLHHCHNLWSSFHGKPYTDAIVTVTKEVDNNMAYLHSINVIANAFDYHYQGLPTEEVLYTLWHYNADCDLEEMEALLMSSLCSFFTIFGWHEMIPFPCQIILYTRLKWPTRAYAYALCTLSQCLLFHGDVKIPFLLMEYGHELFQTDGSPAGQLFEVQYAIFQALYSYLGYRLVNRDVIATISAFNYLEAIYWEAYNMMIGCDWEEAGNLLNNLWISLDKDISYEINDMKIRCLLMQAELDCLCKCSAGALNYLSEALELAYSIHSDVYITLTLSHIASIQCELGLLRTGSRTMEKDMRAAIRCSSPWLKARLNVVNVKLSMRLQKSISKMNLRPLMDKLDWAEELYSKWTNSYRLKEVLHLKAELLDRSDDVTENGNAFRKRLSNLEPTLPWSSSTCFI